MDHKFLTFVLLSCILILTYLIYRDMSDVRNKTQCGWKEIAENVTQKLDSIEEETKHILARVKQTNQNFLDEVRKMKMLTTQPLKYRATNDHYTDVEGSYYKAGTYDLTDQRPSLPFPPTHIEEEEYYASSKHENKLKIVNEQEPQFLTAVSDKHSNPTDVSIYIKPIDELIAQPIVKKHKKKAGKVKKHKSKKKIKDKTSCHSVSRESDEILIDQPKLILHNPDIKSNPVAFEECHADFHNFFTEGVNIPATAMDIDPKLSQLRRVKSDELDTTSTTKDLVDDISIPDKTSVTEQYADKNEMYSIKQYQTQDPSCDEIDVQIHELHDILRLNKFLPFMSHEIVNTVTSHVDHKFPSPLEINGNEVIDISSEINKMITPRPAKLDQTSISSINKEGEISLAPIPWAKGVSHFAKEEISSDGYSESMILIND
jgi:hypothetical protein